MSALRVGLGTTIKRATGGSPMTDRPKIKHLAIITLDPERLAKFYEDVFGMTRLERPADRPKKSKAVFMTIILIWL